MSAKQFIDSLSGTSSSSSVSHTPMRRVSCVILRLYLSDICTPNDVRACQNYRARDGRSAARNSKFRSPFYDFRHVFEFRLCGIQWLFWPHKGSVASLSWLTQKGALLRFVCVPKKSVPGGGAGASARHPNLPALLLLLTNQCCCFVALTFSQQACASNTNKPRQAKGSRIGNPTQK